MHHIIWGGWEFRREPFPSFVARALINRSEGFIPVKGISPLVSYQVTGNGRELLYSGTSLDEAQEAKIAFESLTLPVANADSLGTPSLALQNSAVIKEGPVILPTGQFKMDLNANGTVVVVGGNDETNDLLLMTGAKSGVRGRAIVNTIATTGIVIRQIAGEKKDEMEIKVAAILKAGQQLALHSSGRGLNKLEIYKWDGHEVVLSQSKL